MKCRFCDAVVAPLKDKPYGNCSKCGGRIPMPQSSSTAYLHLLERGDELRCAFDLYWSSSSGTDIKLMS